MWAAAIAAMSTVLANHGKRTKAQQRMVVATGRRVGKSMAAKQQAMLASSRAVATPKVLWPGVHMWYDITPNRMGGKAVAFSPTIEHHCGVPKPRHVMPWTDWRKIV